MIECARGYGCLTCSALLFSGPMVVSPLSLDDGALCGYELDTHLYYCCKSFAVLLHNTWWVGGSLRGHHCCNTYRCCTALVQGCGWVDRFVSVVCCCRVSTRVRVCVMFFFLPLYRLRAGIVQRSSIDSYKYSFKKKSKTSAESTTD